MPISRGLPEDVVHRVDHAAAVEIDQQCVVVIAHPAIRAVRLGQAVGVRVLDPVILVVQDAAQRKSDTEAAVARPPAARRVIAREVIGAAVRRAVVAPGIAVVVAPGSVPRAALVVAALVVSALVITALAVTSATIALDVAIGAVWLAVLKTVPAAVAVAPPIAAVVVASIVPPVATSTVSIELAAIRLLVAVEAWPAPVTVPVAAGLLVGTGLIGTGLPVPTLAVAALSIATLAVPALAVAVLPVPIGAALTVGAITANLGLHTQVGALWTLALVWRRWTVRTLLLERLAIRARTAIATILALSTVLALAVIASAIPSVAAILLDLLRGGAARHGRCGYQCGCRHQEFEKPARHRRRPRLPAHEPAPMM